MRHDPLQVLAVLTRDLVAALTRGLVAGAGQNGCPDDDVRLRYYAIQISRRHLVSLHWAKLLFSIYFIAQIQ
jgi:hypothetical protein